MLGFFRKLGETKGSRLFLGLLALSFAAWGIGGYLVKSSGMAGVTVGGREISIVKLERAYKQRLGTLENILGHKPTPEELEGLRVPEQIIAEEVSRELLRQTAAAEGFVPAVKQLQEEIAANNMFRGSDGKFDPVRYRALLQQIGRSPEQFEEDLGEDLAVRLLARMVRLAVPPVSLMQPLAALEGAKLVLEVATVKGGEVHDTPTEAELKNFYELNQKLYAMPEKRSFKVLELSRAAVSGTVVVPEQRIAEEYEANKASYAVPEKRVVRHILLDTEAKAKELAAGLKTLADFETAANAHSKDPGNKGSEGGKLGAIGREDVVKPFADAAFALPMGQVSAPVQSQFGWHLIWVEAVEPAHTRALTEVKDEISAQLESVEMDDALSRMGKQVDEQVAAGEDLDKVAKSVGLSTKPVAMVTADEPGTPPALLQAAFGTEDGQTSAPIALDDGGLAYVQVTKVEGAKIPALADVKERATKDWQGMQRQLRAQADAEKVLNAVRTPGPRSVADSVAQSGVAGVEISTLDVLDATKAPDWLQPRMLELYQLPDGGALPAAVRDGDVWRVVRMKGRELAKPDAATLTETAKVYGQRLQADMEGLLIGHLQQQARIVCHQTLLRQVFGRDVQCVIE